jgi:uncharacterized MAPEG superfamily protein
MAEAYTYLALSGVFTLLLWTPYILARIFVWGPITFLTNYPKNFPAEQPTPPLWAQRAQRAHLNMVETLPAFIAILAAADYLIGDSAGLAIGMAAKIFFYARLAHAAVYIVGVPGLRTPLYLVSWASLLFIAREIFF